MSTKKKTGLLNASERDGVQYRKAKIWELIIANAQSGCTISFYLLLGFASMIATQGYGIAVALAGTLLTVSGFFDGFTDALFAALFEKFNPKKGKIRIFIFIGWVCSALSAVVLYSWASGKFTGVAGVVVFLIAYNLFRIGYTINGTGGGTIGVIITNDPTQRPMNSVLGTMYSYLVPILYTNVITFVILPKYNNQYNIEMFGEMVWWFVIGSFVFFVLTCIGIRNVDVGETFETISKDGKKDEKVTFKDMWSVLKDNRNVQMYMITGISDRLAQMTGTQSIVTTLLNGVLIGSYAATTMVGNFTQIVGIVFAFGGGIFIAKWGAKKSTVVWSWISIAISAAMVVYCFLLGGPVGMKKLGVMGFPIVLWAVFNLAKTGAMMILTTTAGSMKADIVDYEYERSGRYMPAVVSGVYSFIDKFISSFGTSIAAFAITLVGYTTTVPQMGDEATWPKFWMCMFLVFGLPIIGWLCNIVAMKFYTLDRERMVEVQKNLNARREAAKDTAENE